MLPQTLSRVFVRAMLIRLLPTRFFSLAIHSPLMLE